MDTAAALSSAHIPDASIAAMCFTFMLAVFVPPAAFFLFKKKCPGTKKIGVLIGALVFIVFALVLERMLHIAVFKAAGEIIRTNAWLYALYGGLAAGIFEETGRFLAMKYVMRDGLNKRTSIMYGIGHGGIESILLIGLPYLLMILASLIINHAPADYMSKIPPEKSILFAQAIYVAAVPFNILLAGMERFFTFIIQIGFSYIVYRGVKDKKISLFFAAIGLHFFADASSSVISRYAPVYFTEIYIMLLAAAISFFALKFYRREETEA